MIYEEKAFLTGQVPSRLEVDCEDYATAIVMVVGGSGNSTGVSIAFEGSPDSTSKETGRWSAVQGQSLLDGTMLTNIVSQAINAGVINTVRQYNVGALKRFRARVSAITTGGVSVIITLSKVPAAFTPIAPLATQPVSGTVAVTNTVLASGGNGGFKAEDAVHASGDVGVSILGVRVGAAPAAPTSAAGDYGTLAITSEGKNVPAGQGAEEHQWTYWQAVSTSSTAAKAAVAGVRNMVTDVIVDNNTASSIRVTVLDGASVLFAVSVPANSNFAHSFKSPLRGSVNTAINVQGAAAAGNIHLSGYVSV